MQLINELAKRVSSLEEGLRLNNTIGSRGWEMDTVLTAPAASVTFTVPQYARHLRVVWYARSDRAASTVDTLLLRVNGDAGANYGYQYVQGSGAAANVVEATGATFIVLGAIPAATATANYFGTGVVFIPHYAYASGTKQVDVLSGLAFAFAAGNRRSFAIHGDYQTAAAVASITLSLAAGNFIANSRITCYGLG